MNVLYLDGGHKHSQGDVNNVQINKMNIHLSMSLMASMYSLVVPLLTVASL